MAKPNESIDNSPVWDVFTSANNGTDLVAYGAAAGIPKCAKAFQALGTGTVVVKRPDGVSVSVAVVADRMVFGQCKELTTTTASVIFYW